MTDTLPRTLVKGITLLDEHPGQGPLACRGNTLVFNLRLYLHRGDEVQLGDTESPQLAALGLIRQTDEGPLLDHRIQLGRRQSIAGIEWALLGMAAGGYREVQIAPHLGYGARGLGDRIPPDALLRARIWLRAIGHRAI
jgi:hypothetical protein